MGEDQDGDSELNHGRSGGTPQWGQGANFGAGESPNAGRYVPDVSGVGRARHNLPPKILWSELCFTVTLLLILFGGPIYAMISTGVGLPWIVAWGLIGLGVLGKFLKDIYYS